MSSHRRREGYLLVDHRATGEGLYESATVTCSHCHAVVVLNPDRTREREYCAGCDRYICDGCGAEYKRTRTCTPFNRVLDLAQAAAIRREQAGLALAVPAGITLNAGDI